MLRDKNNCKHIGRSCKWCFFCDNESEVQTITKKQLEEAVYSIDASLLRATERIILAALILKNSSGLEFDSKASELLRKAYRIEECKLDSDYIARIVT